MSGKGMNSPCPSFLLPGLRLLASVPLPLRIQPVLSSTEHRGRNDEGERDRCSPTSALWSLESSFPGDGDTLSLPP